MAHGPHGDGSVSSGTVIRPLLLAPYGAAGGSENVLLRIVERLGDRIDPLAVVMARGPLAGKLRDAGVPTEVEHLPGKAALLRFPSRSRALAERYRGRGISFIHANGTKAAILGIDLSRRLGVPLLWMKHDHAYEGRLTREAARRCDVVVCVSQAMADLLGPSVRGRVVVAYPGVDLNGPPSEGRTAPIIASAGRLDPAKGFGDLIRAAALLRQRGHDDLSLRIAGPVYPVFPDHPAELATLAGELGMSDRVQIGWVDDIDAHWRTARVIAVSSLPIRGRPSEGAPLVLMEGMGHGRPAVGPNEPGVAEVIGDAGTLVSDRTPEGYADALAPYLADSDHADAVGLAGRERVERLFTFDRTIETLERVYRDLAERGR